MLGVPEHYMPINFSAVNAQHTASEETMSTGKIIIFRQFWLESQPAFRSQPESRKRKTLYRMYRFNLYSLTILV